jgi:hypothetical protein
MFYGTCANRKIENLRKINILENFYFFSIFGGGQLLWSVVGGGGLSMTHGAHSKSSSAIHTANMF